MTIGRDGSREINLTKGQIAIVDVSDFELLSRWKWCVNSFGYAIRNTGGSPSQVLMHRQIMNAPPGIQVDHINGNPLDNRRCNLRLATSSQQKMNRRPTASSGYKGVRWHKRQGQWQARIKVEGKERHLGYFDDVEAAARARDEASIIHHGEFAFLNFPDDTHPRRHQP